MKEERPLVSVCVCIRRGDKVLLHKRKGKHSGEWAFPGGHMEYMEDFEETVLRETAEECGKKIKINNTKLWTTVNTLFPELKKHYVLVCMVADWVSGEAEVVEPEKCAEWKWFKWDKLPKKLIQGNALLKDYVTAGFVPNPFDVGNSTAGFVKNPFGVK